MVSVRGARVDMFVEYDIIGVVNSVCHRNVDEVSLLKFRETNMDVAYSSSLWVVLDHICLFDAFTWLAFNRVVGYTA
jgi:hypothetical protein